jgi:hypothetical protein
MRVLPVIVVLLAIGVAYGEVNRRSNLPKREEPAEAAPPQAPRSSGARDAARAERPREAREQRLRAARQAEMERALAGPTTTFQPATAPAQSPRPKGRTYSEEELAHCSALPQYGPNGNIVGYTSNPDCAEYRRRQRSSPSRQSRPPAAPFSTPVLP